nr:hypothetical protein [Actinomycetales bacterium]
MTAHPPVSAVLVDPFENPELRELAELAGLPLRWCAAWPFDLGIRERVVSTVPVPALQADRALGVIVGTPGTPGLGEAWPSRTVRLEEGAASVVSHLAGGSEAGGRVVAVVGTRGGIGTTSLAAALARLIAEVPCTVALVDTDPVPRLASMLGIEGGLAWADLAGDEGPLLPHRLDAGLPLWERVRVLTSDGREGGRERFGAALRALACTHAAVVVDLGRNLGALEVLQPDFCVVVAAGEHKDLAATARVIGESWEGGQDPLAVGRARGTTVGMGGDLTSGVADGAARRCVHVPVVRSGGAIPVEEVALRLGIAVVPFATERGGPAAAAHGSRPGDRPRGALVRAARAVAGIVAPLP